MSLTSLVRGQPAEDSQLHFGVMHLNIGVAEKRNNTYVIDIMLKSIVRKEGDEVARPAKTNSSKTTRNLGIMCTSLEDNL
jgi:hypothetical protein